MKLLEINLATRPFRNNTLYWTGFGSAGAILAALTVVNVWLFLHAGSSVQQSGEEMQIKQAKRDSLMRDEQRLSVKLTKLDFKGLAREAEFANDAIRRRIFSWTELFNRLEEVVPATVMMAAIRPEIQAEGISVVAEGLAKDQEGLLDFEENLIRSPYFSRIYPGSERREQRGGDLLFSLKFDYVPGGRADAPGGPVAPAKSTATVAGEEPKRPPEKAVDRPAAPPVPPYETHQAPPPSNPPPAATLAAVLPAPASDKTAAVSTPHPAAPTMRDGSVGQATSPERSAGKTAVAPGQRQNPSAAKRGPAGRPLLKAGSSNARIGSRNPPKADGRAARTEEAARAAGHFENKPLEDVIDYLMKNRTMTFIFDGKFDLRQKVDMDVYDLPQSEIADIISGVLGAVPSMEAENTWKFRQLTPAETMQQAPVEEEPVAGEPPPAEEPPPPAQDPNDDGDGR